MDLRRANIKTVPFPEYISVLPDLADSSEFDIVIVGESSVDAYSLSLFHKIYSIEFSEIDPFFRYQCNLYKDPLTWLTYLKQLIKENLELFDTKLLVQRKFMFTSQINLRRERYQTQKEDEPKIKKSRKKPNCYSDEKVFCFEEDLAHVDSLLSLTEKILYLRARIKDYTLFSPEYENTQLKKFDVQCQVLIDHLLNEDNLLQQIEAQKQTNHTVSVRYPVNANLKAVCYAFVQLRQNKGNEGKPVLEWTTKQTVDYICNTLCEPDGTLFNPATVRTYLSSNNVYGRPKKDDEINLDGIIL
jgi:hypothetical protein